MSESLFLFSVDVEGFVRHATSTTPLPSTREEVDEAIRQFLQEHQLQHYRRDTQGVWVRWSEAAIQAAHNTTPPDEHTSLFDQEYVDWNQLILPSVPSAEPPSSLPPGMIGLYWMVVEQPPAANQPPIHPRSSLRRKAPSSTTLHSRKMIRYS